MTPTKPKLGQNFLIDPTAAHKIVAALGDISTRTVLEIGPGRGALTSLLAPRARRLVAIEYDPTLTRALHRTFRAIPTVEIIHADVLTTDLAAVLTVDLTALLTADSPSVAVGNLPYYITSPILSHLFAAHSLFSTLVLMVQREVADRITAAPGTSEYGLLSASAQLYSDVETLFTLPPTAFDPPPDVHSTVLRFSIRPRFVELGVAPQPFLAFLKLGFQQKRKTLANNLRAAGYSPAHIFAGLTATGIDPNARAEAVSLDTMARLFLHLGAPAS